MIDNPIDGPKGRALWERADQVLPGGGIYLSRSADLAGRGVIPGFMASAKGCRVTDVDGRSYIDFLCANGPNLLGYLQPEVEEAALSQTKPATFCDRHLMTSMRCLNSRLRTASSTTCDTGFDCTHTGHITCSASTTVIVSSSIHKRWARDFAWASSKPLGSGPYCILI